MPRHDSIVTWVSDGGWVLCPVCRSVDPTMNATPVCLLSSQRNLGALVVALGPPPAHFLTDLNSWLMTRVETDPSLASPRSSCLSGPGERGKVSHSGRRKTSPLVFSLVDDESTTSSNAFLARSARRAPSTPGLSSRSCRRVLGMDEPFLVPIPM